MERLGFDYCRRSASIFTPASGGSFEMKALISAVVLSFTLASPAFAFQCPTDMAAIDAALQTAELTDEQKARVMELREAGEHLHSSGQPHAGRCPGRGDGEPRHQVAEHTLFAMHGLDPT